MIVVVIISIDRHVRGLELITFSDIKLGISIIHAISLLTNHSGFIDSKYKRQPPMISNKYGDNSKNHGIVTKSNNLYMLILIIDATNDIIETTKINDLT